MTAPGTAPERGGASRTGWRIRHIALVAVATAAAGLGLMATMTPLPPDDALRARLERLREMVPLVEKWMNRERR